MAPRRPSAFDVSFPGEATSASSSKPPPGQSVLSSGSISSSPSASSGNLKRKSDAHGPGESRASKQLQLPPVAYYESRVDELYESPDLVITGEDPDVVDDDSESGADRSQDKPIRVLTDFSIFDPKHRNEMVSLAAIEQDDGLDRQFEGAGFVAPFLINEEDEGQEDGLEGELQYVRLGAILRFTLDYTGQNEPVYIETEFAWYILKMPSRRYLPYFQHFCLPRHIAQLVVSTATKYPLTRFDNFLTKFVSKTDLFGKTYEEQHLWDSISEIQDAVDDYKDPKWLRTTALVKHLLSKAPLTSSRSRLPRRFNIPRGAHPPRLKSLIGNPDLQVLKSENQTATHVTPLIASLAQGLVQEDLVVVGPPPHPQNKALLEQQKNAAHARLCKLVKNAKLPKYEDGKVQLAPKSRFLRSVQIGHEKYSIGDFIVVPIGQDVDIPPPFLPDNIEDISTSSTIADYFWFAKIIYIDDLSSRPVHIQWLEHGSQILMEELAHPQELFYNDLCGSVPYKIIAGKVTVHEDPKGTVKPDEFFVKFTHDKILSAFVSINRELRELVVDGPPDDNCLICCRIADQRNEEEWDKVRDEQGSEIGVAYLWQRYHLDDFVLYRSREKGPAKIGYLTGFQYPTNESRKSPVIVKLKCVGRMTELVKILPQSMLRHERDVYLTDEETMVDLKDLIRVCFVFPKAVIDDLEEWLDMSPDHFFISFKFPKLKVTSWENRKSLTYNNLHVCTPCVGEKLKELDRFREFMTYTREHPLPVLDLFGGVGAFSHGLAAGSGCLKLTNTVEISPSAAKTTKRNSPGTKVYNQCANVMLRYCIKVKEGHDVQVPNQLYDDKTPVPGPIMRPESRCVVIGFPCQTHSGLNMFKTADDIKSNLILNALSWVDHLKPDLCYFENVPGFLSFTFNATQAGRYRVEGGIPMGGLKLLVRALIDMRYQVRFALLQAGHYGTPQGRVRFFVVAAADGFPLPDMPQPTHDFPDSRSLQIKLPGGGDPIRPIRATNGTAPHRFITIDDAISDLPRFDWKHPKRNCESAAVQREIRERAKDIPALDCKTSSSFCGYQGQVEYHHPPKTLYQQAARASGTQDIQHFTKCLLPKKVERVVSIPLAANADYRSLRPDQHEWQFSNPLSAVARKNYRPGLYGRLDKNGYFPTTVTNMDPTAKQSKVLNPYCKRMVTVRELARSQGFSDNFVFESIGNNVVTMHRQIGNAVPLPVGAALGRELQAALYRKWLKDRQDHPGGIEVDDS